MKQSIASLTADDVNEFIHYDKETGFLTWIKSPSNIVKVGSIAGSVTTRGYLQMRILGRSVKAHRLAWLVMFGKWPNGVIDHINGITSDNRIVNLRDVTQRENLQNMRKPQSTNTHGYFGCTYQAGKWVASIRLNGKKKYLGRFKCPKEAEAAYLSAKRNFHEFCTI